MNFEWIDLALIGKLLVAWAVVSVVTGLATGPMLAAKDRRAPKQ